MSQKFSKEKFIELYDKHHSEIFRFLRIKLATEELAQDLTSEAFLRAWNTLRDGLAPQNPRAYLYQVARSLLADYYKRHQYEISFDEAMSQKEDLMSQKFESKGERAHILRTLRKLPGDYAELLSLKYVEEFSDKEIAEIVGKSEGAVRVALHRGLRELKNKLRTNHDQRA